MKKLFKKYWNLRPLGIFNLGAVLIKVTYLTLYEKISSFFWRLNLGKTGKNILIQKGTSIRYPGNISLGNNVAIGRNCQISSEFSDSYLHIANNSQINKKCILDYSGGLKVGNNVTISEDVMIQTHTHGLMPRSIPIKTPIEIKDNVWIGARVIILPNAHYIGENSIIGAGSIITKSVEANQVLAGNPVRLIKVK